MRRPFTRVGPASTGRDLDHNRRWHGAGRADDRNVQIHEYSGEMLEEIARESFVPVDFRTGTRLQRADSAAGDGRGRHALSRLTRRPEWMLRTERMAAKTSGEDVLLFIVHVAGATSVHQRDRLAELAVGTGVLAEARSPWEIVSPTETKCLMLTFSRELLAFRNAEITESCARGIDPVAPGMQMLSSYLKQLFGAADRLTSEQRLDAVSRN